MSHRKSKSICQLFFIRRKVKPRVPISASAVAQLMEAMCPSRVVTVDLHCGQIQGFFHKTPVDNLFAENEIILHLREHHFPKESLVIVCWSSYNFTRIRMCSGGLSF